MTEAEKNAIYLSSSPHYTKGTKTQYLMGLGYTWVLLVISFIREFFGGGTLLAGTAYKIEIIPEAYRIGILNSAPGGFLVFGCLMLFKKFRSKRVCSKCGKTLTDKTVSFKRSIGAVV